MQGTIKNIMQKIPFLNSYENEILSEEFNQVVDSIKEKNSETVFRAYYLPKAITSILREKGYLITEQQAAPQATAMMLFDLATGKLNEFYRFEEV